MMTMENIVSPMEKLMNEIVWLCLVMFGYV